MRSENTRMATIAIIIIALVGSVSTAQAYATADSFQNPLSSYQVSGYAFGQYLWSNLYHCGEDLQTLQYKPVYAIANGRVVWSVNGPNCEGCGYGQVVVIEHTLPDGSKICSIYGHLSEQSKYPMVAKEVDVTKGQIIGYIGNDAENGDGGPHLHFGIRKGADTGTWRYQG